MARVLQKLFEITTAEINSFDLAYNSHIAQLRAQLDPTKKKQVCFRRFFFLFGIGAMNCESRIDFFSLCITQCWCPFLTSRLWRRLSSVATVVRNPRKRWIAKTAQRLTTANRNRRRFLGLSFLELLGSMLPKLTFPYQNISCIRSVVYILLLFSRLGWFCVGTCFW
jgi:hypothetical protein